MLEETVMNHVQKISDQKNGAHKSQMIVRGCVDFFRFSEHHYSITQV